MSKDVTYLIVFIVWTAMYVEIASTKLEKLTHPVFTTLFVIITLILPLTKKTGLAIVVFSLLLSSTEAVTSWTTIASTLPKPMIQQRGFLLPEKAIDSRIQYSIKTSGELEIYIAEAITTAGWFKNTITYPVAES